MLHKVKGDFVIECDDCGETFQDEDCRDFGEFMYALKSHDWKIKKVGNDWIHTCPDCKK